MDEFIVWDKKSKKFRTVASLVYWSDCDICLSEEVGTIKLAWLNAYNCIEQKEILIQRESKHFSIHNYIGKTDINHKKIYAESSIVKVDINDDTEHHGYISYNKKYSRYELYYIENPEIGGTELFYLFNHKLEIIDTIQENKLGLIK